MIRKTSVLCAIILAIALTACVNRPTTTNYKRIRTNVIQPDWSRNAVIYEVNLRQYTKEGTIKAFESELPRLKELGVDILWFMPIHPISELNRKGTLGSYYAIRDYKAVNPEFGTSADFKAMVAKAHEMGFKVLLDWVANHTGGDHVWIAQNPEWFVRDSVGNFVSPYDWTDVYKLDYTNPGMRAAMIDALTFWVREYNIDGYRCDVAYEVPTDFWEDARKELDAIKNVFMLAEAEHPELMINAFNMSYNWPLKNGMNDIAAGKQNTLDLDKLLAHQDSIFPIDSYLMNHITNHDLNSWEGTEFDRLGEGVKAFAVLTYTLPGMPLLYTGQETGMNRALEFFEKDTPPDWKKNEWFAFYQQLNALKHSEEALAAGVKGGEMVRYFTESADAYVFSRETNGSEVLVYLNLSNKPVELKYTDHQPEGGFINYFTSKKEVLPADLQPWEYRIYTVG